MVRHLELDAVVQRLAQFKAYLQSIVRNQHRLPSEHLSSTTTATTSRASPVGWDGFSSFTTAAT
ncbi:hypothetical protein Syun_029193 [Stephania yunnanensis]|uniref:Uncharacterized protein n=1 Tax=Stephania yunnanensis TaxID=152371 RepID=A0AAP0ED58_9MAGN